MTLKELLNVVDNDVNITVYSYDDCLTGGTPAELLCNLYCSQLYDNTVIKVSSISRDLMNVIISMAYLF